MGRKEKEEGGGRRLDGGNGGGGRKFAYLPHIFALFDDDWDASQEFWS